MNKRFLLLACCAATLLSHAQITDPKQTASQGASDHVNNNVSNGVNNGLDKTENAIKGLFKKKKKDPAPAAATDAGQGNGSQAPGAFTKLYANYDFVPGDKVIFEDHYADDQDGEFPAHWELEKGQAILNKIGSAEALCLTDGNYARVSPRVKNTSYLGSQFTVEYDVYNPGDAFGPITFLRIGEDDPVTVQATSSYAQCDYTGRNNSADYPEAIRESNFMNKWHHVAIAYNNKQIKVYVDQYRVLVIPDCGAAPASLDFGGIGSRDNPIILANVRIAAGGNMNMIGKKFTDAKIVTHGINFDVDKSTIRPESMGTLNMIVQVLKDNPEVKFEIDGHTDNSGNAPHNLQLSQQRADAVKAQLVTMGVDASRLTAKGFGDTKPIGDNNTLEGKANNRRVEFVKM